MVAFDGFSSVSVTLLLAVSSLQLSVSWAGVEPLASSLSPVDLELDEVARTGFRRLTVLPALMVGAEVG